MRNPDVVVLSFDTWRRHFDGDPAILGRAIEFRAGGISPIPPRLLTVVGVMPPRSSSRPARRFLDADRRSILEAAARRDDDRAARARRLARGGHAGSQRRSAPRDPPAAAGRRAAAAGTALRDGRHEGTARCDRLQPALRVLLAAVGGRAADRLRECGEPAARARHDAAARDRRARSRSARAAHASSAWSLPNARVLALAGGVVGALIGAGGVWLVKELAITEARGHLPLDFWRLAPAARHRGLASTWRLLAIALALAAITAIVFGLLPALQLSRTESSCARWARAAAAGGRRESRTRSIAGRRTAGAGDGAAGRRRAAAHSFVRLMRTDLGYTTAHVLEFRPAARHLLGRAKGRQRSTTLLTRFRAHARRRRPRDSRGTAC